MVSDVLELELYAVVKPDVDAGNPPPGTFCLLKLPGMRSLIVKSKDACLPVSICAQEAAKPWALLLCLLLMAFTVTVGRALC